MFAKTLIICLSVGVAMATGHQNNNYNPQQAQQADSRNGFGANANFNAGDNLGFNVGANVGNPLQSNFLFPVIIGLGLLSLFNIVLTIIGPLLNKVKGGDDDADDEVTEAPETARSQRNIVELASTVMQAIQKRQEMNE